MKSLSVYDEAQLASFESDIYTEISATCNVALTKLYDYEQFLTTVFTTTEVQPYMLTRLMKFMRTAFCDKISKGTKTLDECVTLGGVILGKIGNDLFPINQAFYKNVLKGFLTNNIDELPIGERITIYESAHQSAKASDFIGFRIFATGSLLSLYLVNPVENMPKIEVINEDLKQLLQEKLSCGLNFSMFVI